MTPAARRAPFRLAARFDLALHVDVAAPPDVAWRVIADYARDPEWREGVTMTHEPPGLVQEGTVTRERLRAFGAVHEVVATVHDVVPGERFAFRSIEAEMPARGTRRVTGRGDGARVTYTLEVELGGAYALLRAPLAWLFRRRVERDLARLAARVAGEPRPPTPAARA